MDVDEPRSRYGSDGEGYKSTDIGVIPCDWSVGAIGDIAETSSGTTPSRAAYDRYYKRGHVAWVKTLDLNNREIRVTDEMVTSAALAETSLRVYPPGSVLVAMYGGLNQIGRTGLLCIPAAVNQALTAIRPHDGKVDSDYLLRVLNHRVDYWRSVASSSRKDPNITSKDVRAFSLALPDIPEQQAIAKALSDADALIESLSLLLVKKRQIKQGAMQELLTGRRRLPGFDEAWSQVPLGELFDFKNGLNKAKKFFGHGTPIVNYMDVFSKPALFAEKLAGQVSVGSDEVRNFDVRKGDAFFTRTSETIAEIGLASVMLDETENTVFSGFVLRARPRDNRLNSRFAVHALRSAYVREQIVARASYTTRALTNGRLLGTARLRMPSPEEQEALAEILEDMDAATLAVQAKLEKVLDLKAAMMQALLTGSIRLVQPNASRCSAADATVA
ncbi:restriction endonuclease subunit S [Variovorax sp. J22R115]|uniref:restriction endonuclease subunit S n=1 Tax=Variovorax sp. J22R115 TaxID=3053509 RepID=UPI00257736F1|nr:restriction endonuclease subunit S [Variovorax sp. J22R115]MDM0051399.1 restriction endonuclease subunit S [Variovorax sp. J22R115]